MTGWIVLALAALLATAWLWRYDAAQRTVRRGPPARRLGDQLWDQLGDQLGGQLRGQLRDQSRRVPELQQQALAAALVRARLEPALIFDRPRDMMCSALEPYGFGSIFPGGCLVDIDPDDFKQV